MDKTNRDQFIIGSVQNINRDEMRLRSESASDPVIGPELGSEIWNALYRGKFQKWKERRIIFYGVDPRYKEEERRERHAIIK